MVCRQHRDLLLAATELAEAVSFSATELTSTLMAALLHHRRAHAEQQQTLQSCLALLEQALLHCPSWELLQSVCQQQDVAELMETFLLPGTVLRDTASRWDITAMTEDGRRCNMLYAAARDSALE